jgi:hypothetical protein
MRFYVPGTVYLPTFSHISGSKSYSDHSRGSGADTTPRFLQPVLMSKQVPNCLKVLQNLINLINNMQKKIQSFTGKQVL